MWYCYIIECSDGTLYTGITNNVDARISKHNSGGGAKYTRSRLPVVLKWSKSFETKSEALKEEWRIKQLSRIEKQKIYNS